MECLGCNQECTGCEWFQPCNYKHLKNDFARWIDRSIEKWDTKNQQWKRYTMSIHLKVDYISIRFYGITKDPETQKYMMKNSSIRHSTPHILEYSLYITDFGLTPEASSGEEYIKIPYDRLEYINQIAKGSFGTIHLASWIGRQIIVWDTKNKQWVNVKCGYASIRFYGITRDPETQKYMMVLDFAKDGNLSDNLKNNFNNFGLSKLIEPNLKRKIFSGVLPYVAPEVLSDEEYTKAADGFPHPYHDILHNKDLVMKICNGLRPKIPFHTPKLITKMIMGCWLLIDQLAGNDTIDKFIQDAQLIANNKSELIEWVPYDRLKYIKQIAKGGFGTIHLARWKVVLKRFDNFASLNDDFLNEMSIHLRTSSGCFASIRYFEITQDPETHKYMMVLSYAKRWKP
ncbi:hypothetical protein Glove_115g7 [Diversispora epigaea]|uniref:Protein kinase domain-containing protein n=1 Tax=Diversispora epigaea TaxID=1348612 RepID=A0A397JAG5_9GLOM|nr:hypothetical protein Glove_115g7 [Diversispora epigaea]